MTSYSIFLFFGIKENFWEQEEKKQRLVINNS